MSSSDALRDALTRLWPAIERGMGGLVFTAERAGEVAADMQTVRAALSAPAPAPAEAVAFDAEGFRAFVLRELPDETIIGKGAWWADHLTKCVQWFIKPGAAPAAPAVPTGWKLVPVDLTWEMTQAAIRCLNKPEPRVADIALAYLAMLAAAPSAPGADTAA